MAVGGVMRPLLKRRFQAGRWGVTEGRMRRWPGWIDERRISEARLPVFSTLVFSTLVFSTLGASTKSSRAKAKPKKGDT